MGSTCDPGVATTIKNNASESEKDFEHACHDLFDLFWPGQTEHDKGESAHLKDYCDSYPSTAAIATKMLGTIPEMLSFQDLIGALTKDGKRDIDVVASYKTEFTAAQEKDEKAKANDPKLQAQEAKEFQEYFDMLVKMISMPDKNGGFEFREDDHLNVGGWKKKVGVNGTACLEEFCPHLKTQCSIGELKACFWDENKSMQECIEEIKAAVMKFQDPKIGLIPEDAEAARSNEKLSEFQNSSNNQGLINSSSDDKFNEQTIPVAAEKSDKDNSKEFRWVLFCSICICVLLTIAWIVVAILFFTTKTNSTAAPTQMPTDIPTWAPSVVADPTPDRWTQKGNSMYGMGAGDKFGNALSASDSGNDVAVAYNDSVATFEYDIAQIKWQLVNILDGKEVGESSGLSVCLSGDAQSLFVGAPYHNTNVGAVYHYMKNGSDWIPRGEVIYGSQAGALFGFSISCSKNGNRYIVGAPGNNDDAGSAFVYEWQDASEFELIFETNGAIGDQLSYDVAMPSSGTCFALGSPSSHNGAGMVQVFEETPTGWRIKGSQQKGDEPSAKFGSAVVVSEDCTVLAAGAPLHDHDGREKGKVVVQVFDGTDFIPKGMAFHGENNYDNFGNALGLSNDGNILAIGAYMNGENGPDSGKLYFFKWNTQWWVESEETFHGDNIGDHFAKEIAFSANGETAFAAATRNDEAGLQSGKVKAYTTHVDPTMAPTMPPVTSACPIPENYIVTCKWTISPGTTCGMKYAMCPEGQYSDIVQQTCRSDGTWIGPDLVEDCHQHDPTVSPTYQPTHSPSTSSPTSTSTSQESETAEMDDDVLKWAFRVLLILCIIATVAVLVVLYLFTDTCGNLLAKTRSLDSLNLCSRFLRPSKIQSHPKTPIKDTLL